MSRDLVKDEGMGTRAFCIRGTAGHTQRPGSKGEHGGERRGMLTQEDHNMDLGERKRTPEE